MSSEVDLKRLGRYLAQRRGDVPQETIAKLGGPSTTVQSQLETGVYSARMRARTWEKIDRGYGLTSGSAERVARGGEPHEFSDWPPLDAELSGLAGKWNLWGGSDVDVRQLSTDELVEHWAFLDFEAGKAGREYARRRDISMHAAREELYSYLREGGVPGEAHPVEGSASSSSIEDDVSGDLLRDLKKAIVALMPHADGDTRLELLGRSFEVAKTLPPGERSVHRVLARMPDVQWAPDFLSSQVAIVPPDLISLIPGDSSTARWAAREGVPANAPDATSGEESQDGGRDEPV